MARALGFFDASEEVQDAAVRIISGGADQKDLTKLQIYMDEVDGKLPRTLYKEDNESRMTGAQLQQAQRVSGFLKRKVSGPQLITLLEELLRAQLITTFQRDLENDIPSGAEFKTREERRKFGLGLRARYGISSETTLGVITDIESIRAEIDARPEDLGTEDLPTVVFPGGN